MTARQFWRVISNMSGLTLNPVSRGASGNGRHWLKSEKEIPHPKAKLSRVHGHLSAKEKHAHV